MYKIDIAVIGASSVIAQDFIKLARNSGKNVIEVTSRIEPNSPDNVVIWDYKTDLPILIKEASKIVVFSKFSSLKDCYIAVKKIKSAFSNDIEIYNISSVAVISKPRSLIARLLFKGDDYIRMKKFADKQFQANFNNVYKIYPGLITNNTKLGWEKFLINLSQYDVIYGLDNINTKSNIITLDLFSESLLNYIFLTGEKKLKKIIIPDKSVQWSDILKDKKLQKSNGNIFFDSRIKNLIFIIITSRLIPDFISLSIFNLLRKNLKRNSYNTNNSLLLNIDGMTRFYINSEIE